jgi:hypothetical protein
MSIDTDECIRWARHLSNTARRADLYNKAFPGRPPLAFGGSSGMVTGCWMIGSCYKNPNPLYGAYPHGYLERVHAMFPDAKRILHAFSGGLTMGDALRAAVGPDWQTTDDDLEIYLVDTHGPDQGRYPTWMGDIRDFCDQFNMHGRFDLILADPPYSAEDAEKYDCPPPNRAKIMRALRKVAAPGANLVWLDQVWPMHRKDEWKTWGTIGLVRSTNHRVRLVSMFQAVPPNEKAEETDPSPAEAQ